MNDWTFSQILASEERVPTTTTTLQVPAKMCLPQVVFSWSTGKNFDFFPVYVSLTCWRCMLSFHGGHSADFAVYCIGTSWGSKCTAVCACARRLLVLTLACCATLWTMLPSPWWVVFTVLYLSGDSCVMRYYRHIDITPSYRQWDTFFF